MLMRLFVVLENNVKVKCQVNEFGIIEDMLRITDENPTYIKTIWEYSEGEIVIFDNKQTQAWIEECY